MAEFRCSYDETLNIIDKLNDLPDQAENIINEIIWNQGATLIQRNITNILPVSGRTWTGKAKSAKSSKPFQNKSENLGVVVKTKSKYNYLYFPNDGMNTKNHRGNQQFMKKGAENSTDTIVDMIVSEILSNIN